MKGLSQLKTYSAGGGAKFEKCEKKTTCTIPIEKNSILDTILPVRNSILDSTCTPPAMNSILDTIPPKMSPPIGF